MDDETQIAKVMWTLRFMRVQGDELTTQAVYDKQRFLFFYDLETVTDALREIGNRGYHWAQRYPGVSDACILVGDQRWN